MNNVRLDFKLGHALPASRIHPLSSIIGDGRQQLTGST
jgi:hypothetical protein